MLPKASLLTILRYDPSAKSTSPLGAFSFIAECHTLADVRTKCEDQSMQYMSASDSFVVPRPFAADVYCPVARADEAMIDVREYLEKVTILTFVACFCRTLTHWL